MQEQNDIQSLFMQLMEKIDKQGEVLAKQGEILSKQGEDIAAIRSHQIEQDKQMKDMQEQITRVAITVENDVQPNIQLLLEGQSTLKAQMHEIKTGREAEQSGYELFQTALTNMSGRVKKLDSRVTALEQARAN